VSPQRLVTHRSLRAGDGQRSEVARYGALPALGWLPPQQAGDPGPDTGSAQEIADWNQGKSLPERAIGLYPHPDQLVGHGADHRAGEQQQREADERAFHGRSCSSRVWVSASSQRVVKMP
jgi:hypothetical protein